MDNSKLILNRILQVYEPSATHLGLDRLEEDRLILAFGRWAKAGSRSGSTMPNYAILANSATVASSYRYCAQRFVQVVLRGRLGHRNLWRHQF
ncbi:MAG TPA: hypothetical protein VKB88_45590 [Bryobacteraceae bacterium]|nr:hypothetical protein [Bryobacteraceae bacterium]